MPTRPVAPRMRRVGLPAVLACLLALLTTSCDTTVATAPPERARQSETAAPPPPPSLPLDWVYLASARGAIKIQPATGVHREMDEHAVRDAQTHGTARDLPGGTTFLSTSADGRFLNAVLWDGAQSPDAYTLLRLDARTGQAVAALSGVAHAVPFEASADGRWYCHLSGSRDAAPLLSCYDLSRMSALPAVSLPERPRPAEPGLYHSLVFARDGSSVYVVDSTAHHRPVRVARPPEGRGGRPTESRKRAGRSRPREAHHPTRRRLYALSAPGAKPYLAVLSADDAHERARVTDLHGATGPILLVSP